jgi:hypothetical protein
MKGTIIEKKMGRRGFLYGLITIILFCCISLLQWLDLGSIEILYVAAMTLALFLGIIHVKMLYDLYEPGMDKNFGRGLLATFLLMFSGGLAVAVLYYFLRLDYAFISFITAFIVPYLCYQTYHSFTQIPDRAYKLWHYPVNAPLPDLGTIDLKNIQVVQFVFYKNPEDKSKTKFAAKAPVAMTLGELFFIFIFDYNEKNPHNKIIYLDENNQPYGWLFFIKRGWFNNRHYLDTGLTFDENGVKSGETIYTSRI